MTELPCGCDDRAVGGCRPGHAPDTATASDRRSAAALVVLCAALVVAAIAAGVHCG